MKIFEPKSNSECDSPHRLFAVEVDTLRLRQAIATIAARGADNWAARDLWLCSKETHIPLLKDLDK